VTLQWAVGLVQRGTFQVVTDGGTSEGGAGDAGDAGSGLIDGGNGEAGVAEGGVAEAGVAEAGVAEAGLAEASVAEAGETDASEKVDGASLANLPPLPGVTVCIYQDPTTPCVTTQADGTFTMPGLPPRTDLVLSLVKSGYNSYLAPIETASTDMDGRNNPLIMSPPGTAPNIGVAVDLQTKGIIDAFAVSTSGANMNVFAGTDATQITLTPASGNGPFFVNDNNQIDLSVTSFVGSTAFYYNVAPGTYTLTYANTGYDCEPILFPFGQFGFPVATPAHSLKVVVGAGYVTGIVGALCTVNPVVVAVDGG